MEFTLPAFELLGPKKLVELETRIVKDIYEFKIISINVNDAIQKLRVGNPLNDHELVGLIENQNNLAKLGLLLPYYDQLGKRLGTWPSRKRKGVIIRLDKAFWRSYYIKELQHFYKTILDKYKEEAKISPNTKFVGPDMTSTIANVGKVLGNDPDQQMEISQDIYVELFLRMIKNNNLKDKIVNTTINIIGSFELKHINIMTEFFLTTIYDIKVQNLDRKSHAMIQAFLDILGEPAKQNPNYTYVSNKSIDYINKWLMLNRLHEIFNSLSVDRTDRLDFWKGYFDYFVNLEFYEQYDQCLVIETLGHTIVEFNGPSGGKLYLYNKDHMNIDIINDDRRRGQSKSTIMSNRLKNTQLSYEDMIHSGYWQGKFKRALAKYRYVPSHRS